MFDEILEDDKAGERDIDFPAAQTLQKLLIAAHLLHPDRFFGSDDAERITRPLLVMANKFLGRPDAERFHCIEYEAVVKQVGNYAEKQTLGGVLATSEPSPVVTAVLQGAAHEHNLRVRNQQHDPDNLGRKVRDATLALIDLLNRASNARCD